MTAADASYVLHGKAVVWLTFSGFVQGIVDENTLVWGHGLADWLPIRNVRTLVAQIRTVEGVASLCTGEGLASNVVLGQLSSTSNVIRCNSMVPHTHEHLVLPREMAHVVTQYKLQHG